TAVCTSLSLHDALPSSVQRRIADLVQLLAGADQLIGAIAQLGHQIAQVAGEGIEVVGQQRQLVPPVAVQGAGQVRFALGDIAHRSEEHTSELQSREKHV